MIMNCKLALDCLSGNTYSDPHSIATIGSFYNLTPDTTYYFRLAAVNASGAGTMSDCVSQKTLAAGERRTATSRCMKQEELTTLEKNLLKDNRSLLVHKHSVQTLSSTLELNLLLIRNSLVSRPSLVHKYLVLALHLLQTKSLNQDNRSLLVHKHSVQTLTLIIILILLLVRNLVSTKFWRWSQVWCWYNFWCC